MSNSRQHVYDELFGIKYNLTYVVVIIGIVSFISSFVDAFLEQEYLYDDRNITKI